MNRRELPQEEVPISPATMMCWPGQEPVAVESDGADVPPGTFDGLEPAIEHLGPITIAPYDPVAVLEAMRERKHAPTIFTAPLSNGWNVSLGSAPAKFFPDFPSAVRWLHAQAAAADPTFAQQWPVPE